MNNNISVPHEHIGSFIEPNQDQPQQACAQHSLAQLEQRLTDPGLSNKELGAAEELYAAAWLEQLGWQALASNWQTRFGELDIIMINEERTVVFVEVKTRRTRRYGTPQESITVRKQAHLRHAAALWLAGPGRSVRRNGVRFDAISILLKGNAPEVRHIPGAF